jgi:hypothetical protein
VALVATTASVLLALVKCADQVQDHWRRCAFAITTAASVLVALFNTHRRRLHPRHSLASSLPPAITAPTPLLSANVPAHQAGQYRQRKLLVPDTKAAAIVGIVWSQDELWNQFSCCVDQNTSSCVFVEADHKGYLWVSGGVLPSTILNLGSRTVAGPHH